MVQVTVSCEQLSILGSVSSNTPPIATGASPSSPYICCLRRKFDARLCGNFDTFKIRLKIVFRRVPSHFQRLQYSEIRTALLASDVFSPWKVNFPPTFKIIGLLLSPSPKSCFHRETELTQLAADVVRWQKIIERRKKCSSSSLKRPAFGCCEIHFSFPLRFHFFSFSARLAKKWLSLLPH